MIEQSGHLLVVDDNKVNRLLLARSVELLGHRVTLAENGRVALNHLADQTFDLVLLDIEMPELDGFEVLERMRADARMRELPVIVTSSVEGIDNIVRCIELGAQDYLPKPVNKTLLQARVAACLERKRLQDEQKKLLSLFAADEVAQDLKNQGFAIGGRRVEASILFCDIRDFTALSEEQPPEETIELLNSYYTLMFDAIGSHGGMVNLMIGDGLMAIFGAPKELRNSAQSAVDAARDMLSLIQGLNEERNMHGAPGIRIGIGIATGEVVAGYAGTHERAAYTCIGATVNLAARLEAHTKVVGRSLLIDGETWSRLSGTPETEKHQDIQLKGFSLAVDIFSVKHHPAC